jgi:uncharacterized protein YraI
MHFSSFAKFIGAGLLAALLCGPVLAEQAAVVTANVNLRAGPAGTYPVVVVIPANSPVVAHGCDAAYAWCDVAYGPSRGWVSASFLMLTGGGTPVVITPAAVGVGVVVYDQAYWDRYYVGMPWYAAGPIGYGGADASRSGSCSGGSCSGTREVDGRYGGEVSQTGSVDCSRNPGNAKCSGSVTTTATGRRGNSTSRTRVRN